MQLGDVLLMLGLAYGMGLFWYELLWGKLPDQPWRAAAYPFMGIFLGEAFLAPFLTFDPRVGSIHAITAFVSALIGVLVDWIVTEARRPALVAKLEPRAV